MLLQTGNEILAAIDRHHSSDSAEPDRRYVEQAVSQFKRSFDPKWGGFGNAPKFPMPHNLLFLMRYSRIMQDDDAMKMALITLEDMIRGGIHDQIGGGFCRYSTDDMWLVPHFEKMLYDNALMLMALTKAYRYSSDPKFADAANRTAQFMLRELTGKEGGFFSGQDADSDGVEGKYYVFTPDEITMILGETDGEEFCRLYDITNEGNFEGKGIPNRIWSESAAWDRNDPLLRQLYAYRRDRTKLHTDDKVLVSWNSWAIIGLVCAAQALDEPEYWKAAVKAQEFIAEKMTDRNVRLLRRYRDGESAQAGQLEDYAVFSLALLEMYRVSFCVEYLKKAIFYAEQMMDLFEDANYGGYYMTASDEEKLILQLKETHDGAIPSGNSAAAMVLQRLALLTGEQKWMDAAERQLHFLSGAVSEYPAGNSFALMAMMDALYPHQELICVSTKGVPQELNEYLRKHPADALHILLKTPENREILSQCAPYTAEYPIPGKGASYYLCENGACQSPVSSLSELNI